MITVVVTSQTMDHRTKEHTGPLKFPSLDFFFFPNENLMGIAKLKPPVPGPFIQA